VLERVAVMTRSSKVVVSMPEAAVTADMVRETLNEFGADDYHIGIHVGHYVTSQDLRALWVRLAAIGSEGESKSSP
jgi:hypothetical protein